MDRYIRNTFGKLKYLDIYIRTKTLTYISVFPPAGQTTWTDIHATCTENSKKLDVYISVFPRAGQTTRMDVSVNSPGSV